MKDKVHQCHILKQENLYLRCKNKKWILIMNNNIVSMKNVLFCPGCGQYLKIESEYQVREIVKSKKFKNAAKEEIESKLDRGYPIVFLEKNKIIRLHPNGTKEIIEEIPNRRKQRS